MILFSNQPFKSDSQTRHMECVNLTPFGEFLVWTAEAVIWLRRNYRIIGRASLPLDLFKGCYHNKSKKPDRLPVRLSFEEVALLLSKGFIHGILCSRPVISVAEPSKETIEAYHDALMKNAEEMVNIFKTQKRLKSVGYYGQLLNGLKLRQQRQARSKLFNHNDSSSVNTVDDNGCSKNYDTNNLNSSLQISTRKRRRQRRLLQKQLKKQMFTNDSGSVGNDDDHCNIYDSSDQDVFELSDSLITLDNLISEHSNTRQGTSRLSVISSENIKESLPYIPQHLPRPTPIEWRRPDEYVFVSLPESVFSEGLYSIVTWLIQLIQEKCKTTNFSNQHTDDQNNISSTQDMYIQRLQSCLIYMDLWNKGYYISTSTVKMGGDLLVYQGDPLLYHGSHIITICNPTDPFCNSQLLAKLRIASGLKKILVLATVSNIEMFTRKFTVQRIKHCEIKNDNDDEDNDGSVVDPPVIVSEHSKLSVQSKEITSNDSTHSNCNSSTNKIQPNVIYLSLQYMSSHSSNPTFSKSL
uniref:tRNA-intron lyase n=2 Tax=Schistosoma haematobium TaxID=6185 RepID=A0A094ZCE6_SCHHA